MLLRQFMCIIDDISDHLPICLYLVTGDSFFRHIIRKKVFDKAKAPQLRNLLTVRLQNLQNTMTPIGSELEENIPHQTAVPLSFYLTKS